MPPAGALKAPNFNTSIICCVLYANYSPVNKWRGRTILSIASTRLPS